MSPASASVMFAMPPVPKAASGAPLATKPEGAADPEDDSGATEPGVMDRLLSFLAKTLEPAYGFASLFTFKSKFNPTYETLWMAYPDAVALPAIGNAIGRAYLPDANAREYLALPNVKGSALSDRRDGLYLQFRHGKLAGWKGDWGTKRPCCN